MNLYRSLDLTPPIRFAIVGAGGKTTALFQLARQCPGQAWVTTTTHLGTDQMSLADKHFVLESTEDLDFEAFNAQKVSLLTGPFTRDDRVRSPAPEILERIHLEAGHRGIALLMESDGSRSIPLKAPGEHEPPIPAWVTHVLVVVGLSALGRPLNDQTVYRAQRFTDLTGLKEGEPVTIESIKAMLLHPAGGLKNIPPGARRVALFNQADTPELRAKTAGIVDDLLYGGFDSVLIGGLGCDPDGLVVFSKNS